jgi:acyl-CoA thioesterase
VSHLEPAGMQPRWPDELSVLAHGLDSLFRSSPFSKRMGVEIEDWGLGWARTRMVPTTEMVNVIGTAHGGVVVGLADAAFEIACNSYGRQCVAIDITTHFHAPGRVGRQLSAEAREVSRSARLASYEITVTEQGDSEQGDPSRSVATLLALAYRTDEWHLGGGRYPDEWKAHH